MTQQTDAPSRPPIEIRHHHTAASVPDIEASIAWYRDILGFELEYRFGAPEFGVKAAVLRRGDMRVELFDTEGAAALPAERRLPETDVKTHGTKHAAYAVRDARATFEDLQARGVDIVRFMEGDIPAVYIRDNAGNLIEFVQQPDLF